MKHQWRCDICHRFIEEGAIRHLHCQIDKENDEHRRRELLKRVDRQLATMTEEDPRP